MTATVLRGDALRLPLADESVDLVVTSPPYFGLRSYTDGGQHYPGQLGSEPTPAEYVDALLAATREMVRVLKPSGSIWVNLGDKYAGSGQRSYVNLPNSVPPKSLLGIPWRYALACIDQLGLILRAEIIWSKPNGLPESVTDRVRRSHEQWFHFVRQPRYYSAVDEIREPQNATHYEAQLRSLAKSSDPRIGRTQTGGNGGIGFTNPPNLLGKLPGSVWTVATEPLTVPPQLGVDHFAAFPTEFPRRIIAGWSPPGICVECGEGRRPVVDKQLVDVWHDKPPQQTRYAGNEDQHRNNRKSVADPMMRTFGSTAATITGYVCACTPYTDHPGTGEDGGPSHAAAIAAGVYAGTGANWGGEQHLSDRPKVGPWREYHHDQWTPAPTRPAVVLDPFGGTGTVALVADILGRHGVSVDLSQDYNHLARWRTTDPGQRARAARVDKPPPVIDGQLTLEVGT